MRRVLLYVSFESEIIHQTGQFWLQILVDGTINAKVVDYTKEKGNLY